MLWVGAMQLLTKGLSWLAVVHGYEVPFVFQPNALFQNEVDVLTAILQSSSEDTQHAQNTAVYTVHAVYPVMKTAE